MLATSLIAELCVHILTWNVASHQPDRSAQMFNALALNGTSHCSMGQDPDILVVGLQEINTEVKHQILSLFHDSPWTFWVRDHLDHTQFSKVKTEDLQGMLIMLFVQQRHIPHIRDIDASTTGTGIGNVWGNKGAVSIRLSLYGVGVTFVNSHLAAHDEHLNERLQDYRNIMAKHRYDIRNYQTIIEHEYIFWFGDLNFRLTGETSAEEIKNMVINRNYEELLKSDQLIESRRGGYGFRGFSEGNITFAPTFKFVEGSSEYNLKRRPAWCDRIMYRIDNDRYEGIKLELNQLEYRSYPEYTTSDHKPVSSTFIMKIIAETGTDDDLHVRTHGGGTGISLDSAVVVLSSVLFLLLIKG